MRVSDEEARAFLGRRTWPVDRSITDLAADLLEARARIAALEPFAGWFGLPHKEFSRRWPGLWDRWSDTESEQDGEMAEDARRALGEE